jgi:DNA-binding CsgD family transcriptional regulator
MTGGDQLSNQLNSLVRARHSRAWNFTKPGMALIISYCPSVPARIQNTRFLVLLAGMNVRIFVALENPTSPLTFNAMMKVSISSKELEILRKSAEGQTVKQIADDLNVSQQLISRSQKQILLRTGAGNLVNALQALARRGFVLTEECIR